MSQADDDTLPGKTGDNTAAPWGVRVYDVPAAAATAEFQVMELDGNGGAWTGTAGAVWLSFMSDQEFYIIWGDEGATPAPDPTARWNGGPGLNPTQQCIRVPANYEYMRKVTRQTARAFRMIGDGTNDAVVRVERTSILMGASNAGA